MPGPGDLSGCALSHRNQKRAAFLLGSAGRQAGPTRSEGSATPTQPSQPTRRAGPDRESSGCQPGVASALHDAATKTGLSVTG